MKNTNKLTPLEIHQQRFTVKFRGYQTAGVDEFLDQVSETLEIMISESEDYRETIRRLTQENQDYRSREESYKRVMLNSQKVLEQMTDNARKSSELIVAQAEVDADAIIQSAHRKLAQMHDEINELKRQQVQFRAQMKAMIESHGQLLELSQVTLDETREDVVRQIDYD